MKTKTCGSPVSKYTQILSICYKSSASSITPKSRTCLNSEHKKDHVVLGSTDRYEQILDIFIYTNNKKKNKIFNYLLFFILLFKKNRKKVEKILTRILILGNRKKTAVKEIKNGQD